LAWRTKTKTTDMQIAQYEVSESTLDSCIIAIQNALDIVAEEPMSAESIADELVCFSTEVPKQTRLDDDTQCGFLDNPLVWRNMNQHTYGDPAILVPTELPQVFDADEWDEDEILETSSTADEREGLYPGTVRRRPAGFTAFLEANARQTRIPTMMDARTRRPIEYSIEHTPSHRRSDSTSTQSSASLQTVSTTMTTSNSLQGKRRRAAWNKVIGKVEHRLKALQVPVPFYVDVFVLGAVGEVN
ncbi:hypothetical protein C8Q72DRAFT_851499, partial [Fomitopsis betulina]